MNRLLARDQAALLVIDVQDRINAVMADQGHLPRIEVLVEACRNLGVPVVGSEQYPQGLGPTVPFTRRRPRQHAPRQAHLLLLPRQGPSGRTRVHPEDAVPGHRHRDPRLRRPDRARPARRRLPGPRSPRRHQLPPIGRQDLGPPSHGARRRRHHLHRKRPLRARRALRHPRLQNGRQARQTDTRLILNFEFLILN